MKIHELTIEALNSGKRLGRGIGSGKGKTAGRGTKGQNSRSGGGVRPGFEGGQNPLAKRLPKKRGFAALNPTTYQTVTLARLEKFKGSTVTAASLAAAGVIKRADKPVKILGSGGLTKKLSVNVHAATAGAKEAIEKAGGSFKAATIDKTPKKPSKRNRQPKA
ncbi:MAG TPA: 50S ribosomal protein L15 [Candidatus Saccharimonadales bacterium]|nr:50S ribosomal protein L15 [Candidatus Saccharimonadales bacterium]